jgi:hypothetical protein
MRSCWQRVVVGLAAVAALAGCSDKTAGSASAGSTGAPSSSSEKASGSAKPTSSSKPAVNRPKSIDLKGVDPCSLLTDAQRQQLGLTSAPRKTKSTAYPGNDGCGYDSDGFKFDGGVVPVVNQGIEQYGANPDAQITPITVGGFPAKLSKLKGISQSCLLGLDVADGQLIALQMHSSEGGPQDQLCQKVQTVGEAVITTLTSR